MKGLVKLGKLAEEMPLVYGWLKHAEATLEQSRKLQGQEGEEDLCGTAD